MSDPTEKEQLIADIKKKILSDPFGTVDNLINQIIDLQRSNEELAFLALQWGAAPLPEISDRITGVI